MTGYLTTLVRTARATALCGLSAGMFITSFVGLLPTSAPAQKQTVQLAGEVAAAVRIEHRFTAIETGMENIGTELAEMKKYQFLVITGMAGLLGETGVRVFRRRRSQDEAAPPEES